MQNPEAQEYDGGINQCINITHPTCILRSRRGVSCVWVWFSTD